MWRALVAGFSMVLATAGAATPGAAPTSARLTIDARTGSATSVLVPSQATLQCDGSAEATGFLQKVAKPACDLVRRGTLTKVAKENRTPRLCSELYGGPQTAHIVGTVGGRRINLSIDRSDGCGIADWEKVQALLGDPERRGSIPRKAKASGSTTTAPPTTYSMRRGDTLTKVAKQFHTSVSAIVAQNHLTDPDHLAEGQTLVIPPPSAVRIDAKLVEGTVTGSGGVKLTLVGAQPTELITFQIMLPDGSTYTGSPHSASALGVVTTTYSAKIGSGTYTVVASGTAGTNAQTSFHVDPGGG